MAKKYTTIAISPEVKKQLAEMGNFNESWDDLIRRAVEEWKAKREIKIIMQPIKILPSIAGFLVSWEARPSHKFKI